MTAVRLRALLTAVIASLVAACLLGDGILPVGQDALHLSPFLALVLLLWRRRYPGEEYIVRRRLAVQPRRSRPTSDVRPRCASPQVVPPRGGCLIGHALAVRPPPAEVPGVLTR